MKNFRTQVILKTIFLAITFFLAIHFYYTHEYLISVLFIIGSLIQIYMLFVFIDTTNTEITKFLQGLNYSDFSQNINISGMGKTFKELSDELNRVLSKFRFARMEKEESLKYLQTVVEHIGIGLICFDSNGEVELLNKSAKRILKIPYLKNIAAMNKKFEYFGDFIFHIPANKKQIYKLNANGEILQLLLSATEFRMKNQNMKLVSFYNIQQELEEKEIEAWQKLIRVLTHEIMNSITPISSLASTVNNMLKNSIPENPIQNESVKDICEAIGTIQKRSEGLINFVNKYRDISKIPKPNFQQVNVSELFYRIRLLADQILSGTKINFTTSIQPENLEIIADPDLLEQVILNLINNSVHSLANSENACLKLTAKINDRSKAVIIISDNGEGISEDIIEKIFIPFFSTKKEGSGIGLSISQSIIRAHGGTIWVQSKPNSETVFTITL